MISQTCVQGCHRRHRPCSSLSACLCTVWQGASRYMLLLSANDSSTQATTYTVDIHLALCRNPCSATRTITIAASVSAHGIVHEACSHLQSAFRACNCTCEHGAGSVHLQLPPQRHHLCGRGAVLSLCVQRQRRSPHQQHWQSV